MYVSMRNEKRANFIVGGALSRVFCLALFVGVIQPSQLSCLSSSVGGALSRVFCCSSHVQHYVGWNLKPRPIEDDQSNVGSGVSMATTPNSDVVDLATEAPPTSMSPEQSLTVRQESISGIVLYIFSTVIERPPSNPM